MGACRRNSPSGPVMSRARLILITCLAAAASGTALAFLAGGHHYTLLAIYRANRISAPTADKFKLVEAFCAQLPDLSAELDAVTQRVRVGYSGKDSMWGFLSRCESPISRHMVASQYYLHALTGTKVPPVRDAAAQILQELRAEFSKSNSDQEKAHLACQIGFAAHLLGDTFAHARLDPKKSDELYDTGLGHASDFSQPDYILTRRGMKPGAGGQNSWVEWAKRASQDVDDHALDAAVTSLEQDIFNGIKPSLAPKNGEPKMVEGIRKYLIPEWQQAKTSIEQWSGNHFTVKVMCQDQIDSGVRVGALMGGVSLKCEDVWRDYLARADVAFKLHKVDVGSNSKIGHGCLPNGDKLEDGVDKDGN